MSRLKHIPRPFSFVAMSTVSPVRAPFVAAMPHQPEPKAHEPKWPKRIIFEPEANKPIVALDSGLRRSAKTWFGITKGILLNVGIAYSLPPHSLKQAVTIGCLSAIGTIPKNQLGVLIEDFWNTKVRWGIKHSDEGKVETQPRIVARNISRKFASNLLDATWFLVTSGGNTSELATFSGSRFAATLSIDLATDNLWNRIKKWGVVLTDDPKDPRLKSVLERPRYIASGFRNLAAAVVLASEALTSRNDYTPVRTPHTQSYDLPNRQLTPYIQNGGQLVY